MKRLALSVCFMILAGSSGYALPPESAPVENVTVTGTRSRPVLDSFVQSFATPTRTTGKIARWEDGICPITVGLPVSFTKFVTQQVKDVAAQVGAPVNSSGSCERNIAIVFTTKPQDLLDNIRKKQPWFLGYSDNSSQTEKLATVTHPIQAWYMTATRDLSGRVDMDSSKTAGPGLELAMPCPGPSANPGTCYYHFPDAHADTVTGTRLGDGLRSTFYDVIIVVNPDKLVDHEIGALADYISMLALTQLNSLDTCQQLPSIVNLLAPDCSRSVNALTDNDLAYLRGLYKMSPGRTLRSQQDEVATQMEKALEGR